MCLGHITGSTSSTEVVMRQKSDATATNGLPSEEEKLAIGRSS